MPQFQTVVFDFDGTIASTLPLIYRVFNAVLEPRIGKRLPDAEIRSHFGPPDQVILGRYVGEAEQQRAYEEYVTLYEREHNAYVALFEGMREILVDLKAAGVRIGVMTGKSRLTAEISFRELNIAGLIDVLVAGDDVTMPKPHPEGVIAALNQLGHPNEDTGAMVGDSAADIYAGRDAGVTTIGVTWGVPEHNDLFAAHPDIVCETTAELRTALGLD